MITIDNDLAQKMKDEVKGEEGTDASLDPELDGEGKDGRVLVDSKVLYHVERLKKMFNVKSLDEIIEATPIKRPGSETGEDASMLNVDNDDDDATWHDDTLDRVNALITKIEGKLSARLKTLNTEKKALIKDKKLSAILAKMVLEGMNKIREIKKTYEEHKANLQKREGRVRELEANINQLEMEKIKHLEKLEKFADVKKEQALYTIGKDEAEASSGIESDYLEDISKELEKMEKFETIDTSAHNVFPLKKIKKITKIKSLTVGGGFLSEKN